MRRSVTGCDAAQSILGTDYFKLISCSFDNDLEIIPVLNKIDLPSANVEEVTDDIIDLLGCEKRSNFKSRKTGEGVDKIISAIIDRIPLQKGNSDLPLQALIFDSVFNPFLEELRHILKL